MVDVEGALGCRSAEGTDVFTVWSYFVTKGAWGS